jgi:hypothetical protein
MLERLREGLGTWTSKPTNWIVAATTAVTAIMYATEHAQSLTNQWFRWGCTLAILLLCIVGWLTVPREKPSQLIGVNSDGPLPVKDQTFATLFGVGVFASLIVLFVDVGLNISGFFPVVYVSHPTVTGGTRLVQDKPAGVAAVDSALAVPLSDTRITERLQDTGFQAFPSLEFLVQKRESIKEVVIQDLILTVWGVRPRPDTGLAYRSAGSYNDELIIYFELASLADKWPWHFHPRGAVINGTYHPWRKDMISLREAFAQKVRVAIASRDEGLYEFTLDMMMRSDFDHSESISVTKESLAFLYVPHGD